ncbi:MAG: hypothetical protein WAO35_23600 [Terriglobia bacterium]
MIRKAGLALMRQPAVLPNRVVRINQFEELRKPARPDPVAGK